MIFKQYNYVKLQIFRGISVVMLLGFLSQAQVSAEPIEPKIQDRPLRLGLLPFLTPSVLIKKFHPMIEYLEVTLKRPVIASSAPNFETYIARIEQGQYDMFLAAPHISAYMEKQHQSRRIARFNRELKGYFVVHKNSDIYSIDQLKDRTLAMPDPLAIISILGELVLIENDLGLEHDVKQLNTTHNNALLLVAHGRQDAAVVGISSFDNASSQVKSRLRILTETATVPHMMFHSRADLAEDEYRMLKAAMLRFTAQGAGKAFFDQAAFGDLSPIRDQELLRLTKLVELLEDRLN